MTVKVYEVNRIGCPEAQLGSIEVNTTRWEMLLFAGMAQPDAAHKDVHFDLTQYECLSVSLFDKDVIHVYVRQKYG